MTLRKVAVRSKAEGGVSATARELKGGKAPEASARATPAAAAPTASAPAPAPSAGDGDAGAVPARLRRLPTGVRRLDQLLGGGIPAGSAVLVYGPPFLGKEALAHRFVQHAVEAGVPAICVLTNTATADVRNELAQGSPGYVEGEARHLARFVDTYSRSIGAEDGWPDAQYLDGALDLNGISLAVNKAQAGVIGEHDAHALVLDSISTLVAYSNAGTAFRFLQTLIGRTRRVGATSLFLMDHGMHAEADVQMFKHLMSGVIEVRDANGKSQMRVEGLGAPVGVGWVDYKFDANGFEVTGSFAAGRIR